ncbi:MAG TPA: recombination protein NinB [Methylotenera sp.]|nr:recombination protein NinB [Methylotenera sp.]
MSIESFYLNAKNTAGLIALLRTLDLTKLWRIRIDEYDEKTRLQEEKYHAMLGDVARQAKHLNRSFDKDAWKRLCVAEFRLDCIANKVPKLEEYWKRNSMELVPSLSGSTLVTLGAQTREFPKYVAAGFIEWLYFYGTTTEPPIVWTEPEQQWDERYAA